MTKLVDQLERLDSAAEVERAGGLIEEQDRRVLGEGPGQHESLKFTAGHRREVALSERTERKSLQEFEGALAIVRSFGPEISEVGQSPERHVVHRAHLGRELWFLRNVGHELRKGPRAESER